MEKLIVMMMVALVMVGCSSIEDKAISRMEETLKELAYDPSSVEISGTEVVFSTDSIALIECKFRANNAFGTEIKNRIEYVYYIGDKHTYEYVRDLSCKKSSMRLARDSFDKMGYDTYGTDTTPSFHDYLQFFLVLEATMDGRKIE